MLGPVMTRCRRYFAAEFTAGSVSRPDQTRRPAGLAGQAHCQYDWMRFQQRQNVWLFYSAEHCSGCLLLHKPCLELRVLQACLPGLISNGRT